MGLNKKYSNYSGWLLKVGEYTVPTDRFVAAESYKASAYMQDVDPFTDMDGYVHRNAVKLKALKVEFETPAMLTDEDFAEFMYHIDQNIIDKISNECYITAFIPRYNQYFTQRAYFADVDPTVYGNYNGKVRYNPIRIAFTGGVFDG